MRSFWILGIGFALVAVLAHLDKQTSMVEVMKAGLTAVSLALIWAGERAGRRAGE